VGRWVSKKLLRSQQFLRQKMSCHKWKCDVVKNGKNNQKASVFVDF